MRIVDGGHRAIKYTRLGGVKKEIYNEGNASSLHILHRYSVGIGTGFRRIFLLTKSSNRRNSFHDPMV